MKLYMVPLAPNPTKVMLYIAERAELGVDMGIEQIVVNTVKGRHKEPAHLARNPFGTVPVLELDDGSHLVESLAIIEYLEDRFPENGLLGATPEERGKARDVERIIDLRIAGPMGQYGHAKNSPLGRPPNPELAARMEQSVQTPLGLLGGPPLRRPPPPPRRTPLHRRLHPAGIAPVPALRRSRPLRRPPTLRNWDTHYRTRPAPQNVLRW